DAAVRAELPQQHVAAAGEAGLERVGGVVEAGVQHSAVAPGRVLGEVVLLLQHDDGRARVAGQPGVGEGESDDAAADHGDVGGGGHGSLCVGCGVASADDEGAAGAGDPDPCQVVLRRV